MATLVYSDKCPYSQQIIQEIRENPALLHIIRFHNVSIHGVPSKQITRVPTIVTNDNKIFIGKQISEWIETMKPQENVSEFSFENKTATSSLDDSDENTSGGFFDIGDFHKGLSPTMTQDLENKINRKVMDAYQKAM
jgi:hypothetical protein